MLRERIVRIVYSLCTTTHFGGEISEFQMRKKKRRGERERERETEREKERERKFRKIFFFELI